MARSPNAPASPSLSTLPPTRRMCVIAQDPSVRNRDGSILMAEIEVPAEELAPGPRGYRVHVIDYDASTGSYAGGEQRHVLIDCGSPSSRRTRR